MAWRRAVASLGSAGEHPGQLDDALLAGHRRGQRDAPAVAVDLAHGNLGVGKSCHLGQVGNDDDLVAAAQLCERPADGESRLATNAGVDLVENERQRSLNRAVGPRPCWLEAPTSTRRSANIARASLPPKPPWTEASTALPGSRPAGT